MKRTFWFAAVALALTALVTIPVMAQPPQGRGAGRGAGIGMGPGGPGPGPMGAMGVLRQLDLTDAQREQIRAITEEQRQTARPGQKVMELQQQLQLAIFADTPDAGKLNELKTALAAAEAEMLEHRIANETKIAQVLTAEQRAKARELLAQAPPRRGGGGPRW